MKKIYLVTSSLLATALVLSACGKGGGNNEPAAGSASATDPDPNNNQLTQKPAAADLVDNSQTQAQVAAAGMDSAASSAASGLNGTTSTASLMLDGGLALNQPSAKVVTGDVTRDCYLGSTLTGRSSSGSLTWPEAADSSSIFADSKTDSTTTTNMSVEPALIQYPASSPTSTLKLSAPFAFANLVEVIQKDNRAINITLNDKAQTTIEQTSANEEHRFWVAAQAITGQTSTAMTCGPTSGSAAKGSSGSAAGTFAHVKWSDKQQVNGLNLLTRFANSGSSKHSYLPRKAGVLASTPVTLNAKFGATGYRLAQWTVSTADVASIANASYVRQKTVTHTSTRTDQYVDGNGAVKSDLSHVDEVRASDPLIIQSYFDASDTPLAQVVQSGTVAKTGKASDGTVKWFTTMSFKDVKYDLVNSSEACIPVAGTATLTIFDKEGGNQLKQIVISYASVASAAGGSQVDPQISVAGDDADSTRAKWLMLAVNRKCDLK